MIAREFDVLERMFDVIFNEAKKYFANARKLEAKHDSQGEPHDLIATVPVKPKASQSNMLRVLTCKAHFTSSLR